MTVQAPFSDLPLGRTPPAVQGEPLQALPLLLPAVNLVPPSGHSPVEAASLVTLVPFLPAAPAAPAGPAGPTGPAGPAGPALPVLPLGPGLPALEAVAEWLAAASH